MVDHEARDAWTVAEKYNYPAAFEKVRKVLVDLTELRPLEQKTSTPSLVSCVSCAVGTSRTQRL